MTTQIIPNKEKINNFNEFLSKGSEFTKIYPVTYVLTGSPAYGLADKPFKEYVGIHILDTSRYLQHPEFKNDLDITRSSYDENFKPVSEDNKNKSFSITSFEIWKFISLYLKGSLVVYDTLYLSSVFDSPEMLDVLNNLKKGINNKISISSKRYALNNWKKDKKDLRKVIMSYYRLLQAIVFLREEQFVSDINDLWQNQKFNNLIYGRKIYYKFVESNFEKAQLLDSEIAKIADEFQGLIDEVNKASIATRLPDKTSSQTLNPIFDSIIKKRIDLVYQN